MKRTNFMKKIAYILIFALLAPLAVCFSACKKSTDPAKNTK